jgi:signal transduction histidine kinase
MAIKVKARVLLELGSELISSDPIAIYELVKNSLDARASRIQVVVHVVLQRSDHLRIAETMERHLKKEKVALPRDTLRELLESAFDSAASQEMRDAYIEAVAAPSSIDRPKALVEAYRTRNWIEVRDDGLGMSLDELDNLYLTVGTPNRLLQRTSDPSHATLGEKGIGRLSAVRLGDFLVVSTSKAGETRLNTLTVDWGLIKEQPDLDLGSFPAQPKHGTKKEKSAQHGTVIRMSNLMSDWSEDKLKGLARTDFAKLVDPFLSTFSRPNVRLIFNDVPVEVPAFESRQLSYAHAHCTASLQYNKAGDPVLTGQVDYKTYARKKVFTLEGLHLQSTLALRGRKPRRNQPVPELAGSLVHGLAKLGEFSMEAHWFNRQKLRLDKPEGFEAALQWLVHWGGGLLLYRDNYRVYPYAEARDDWLDLDGVALATAGYKMNRKQLVGAVRISGKRNPRLLDQTNREGLRDTEEKAALIALLRYVLMTEFKTFLNAVEGDQEESAAKEFPKLERRLEQAQKDAVKQIQHLRTRVSAKEDVVAINILMAKMADVTEAWEKSKLTVRKYERDLDTYVHLAGVGLMTEFIFHELARISASALGVLNIHKSSSPVEGARLRTLRDQLVTLDKRIRILDPLSTPGRQRKEAFDLAAMLRDIAEAHSGQFERHHIECDLSGVPKRPLEVRAIKGQVVQIIENFVANSVYWLKLDSEVRKFKPKIGMSLDITSKKLHFWDNGPGIPVDRGDEVFNAFFTTKPAGEGRGLGLYIAQKLAEGNAITIELDAPDAHRIHHGFEVTFEGAY